MSDWPVQSLWKRRTTADIIYIIYIELDGYVGRYVFPRGEA